MRVAIIFILIVCIAGGYLWWKDFQSEKKLEKDLAAGFVAVEMPEGAPQNSVIVLAPQNCPSAQAKRAEALIAELKDRGIPVTRGDTISFSLTNPTAEQSKGVDLAIAVFKRGAPAVFVNGLAMSNPSISQVVEAYRSTRK